MAPASERENAREGVPNELSVSAHQSSPDRTVFTEDGNTDAWIATDLTVDLHR